MTWARRARGSLDRIVRHFGGGQMATLRWPHSLLDQATGEIVENLTLLEDAAQDAAAIRFNALNLAGKAVPGMQFTLFGDATIYEVTDAAEISDGVLEISITPALAAAAAAGTLASITRPYGEVIAPAMLTHFSDADVNGESIRREDRIATLSLLGVDGLIDEDARLEIGGDAFTIQGLMPLAPGQERIAIRLHVRGGP